ncbi:MAG TPA: sigma-70 family RNA polymerase sigma factor [Solirubrobacterales bacterium]|nr:sigma-70 family RNA polymerase sigma factor [Solirubrobacterales bacterium]
MDAARKRAAVEAYAQNEATLRRTARRYSLCLDDAEDALQRSLEILLRKAPSEDPRHLIKWMQTVVKREAITLRGERERAFAGPAALEPEPGRDDWVSLLPAESDGPPERAEREETIARSREALRALKPHELRALSLLAHGYSYVEIGEITGFSQTKVNKSLAAGRERFRRMVARSEGGERCQEVKPLLSAFCDGAVTAAEASELREHLRACAHCRATLRAYRAAPAAASALAPALPLHRSLWERAHDAVGELAQRFGGGTGSAATAGSGVGGTGIAGVVKVAAICISAAGGAVACVASGIVPSPLAAEQERPARLERQLTEAPKPRGAVAKVDYEPAKPPAPEPKPGPEPKAAPPAPEPRAESEPAPEAPVNSDPVEYEPPAPAPEPEPAPVTSSTGDSPAGEFGP